MAIEYSLDPSLDAVITEVLSNTTYTELDDLRTQDVGFVVAAVRKTKKDGDPVATSGAPVKARKVSAADAVFLPNCMFKIYVDMKRWDETNGHQHNAMVHSALMRVKVEVKNDAVKFTTRPPDVETYLATVGRFGCYEEPLLILRDNLAAAKARASEIASAKKK